MNDTQFTNNTCSICGADKITLDQHYNLTPCFDFILLCPQHPAEVFFNLTTEEVSELILSD